MTARQRVSELKHRGLITDEEARQFAEIALGKRRKGATLDPQKMQDELNWLLFSYGILDPKSAE